MLARELNPARRDNSKDRQQFPRRHSNSILEALARYVVTAIVLGRDNTSLSARILEEIGTWGEDYLLHSEPGVT